MSGRRKTLATRCGRRITVSRAELPVVPTGWVALRISSGRDDDHVEWVSLSRAEAAALGEALLEQAREV
ncbi:MULTISPECIES: hypothetical protein [Amycolatopsis]|uniref:Uncharacterized protein n=2 Tax=Amycolatopsis TaxID=1813 RepID=A0A1I3K508_9PSEU|nr:hypothetical protein [Amycolatopsis sacchari]SFI67285.1 hypothetical protein SAMN05421835_101406 [Amycolatopsis sacchari]